MTKISTNQFNTIIIASAALILAFEPIRWLVNTWLEPAYDSKGFYIFAAVAALFLWSVTSPATAPVIPHKRQAIGLLLVTALVRLIGQVLAINTIGALTLAIDVYALGLLAGLKWRARPISPGWLALAFAFSLPLERIAQRTIGYGLQNISADGACMILGGFYDQLSCQGVRITLAGKDVLVDLPCSGARTLLLLMLGFTLLAALIRPSLKQAVLGGALTLTAGLLVNMLRISLLAVGIAEPAKLGGIDVMAQPWHDLIGLGALTIGVLPLIWWSRWINDHRAPPTIDERCRHYLPDRIRHDGWWLETQPQQRQVFLKYVPAIGFLLAALAIISLPRQALDVAKRNISIELPGHLDAQPARLMPLLPAEKSYFIKYGGAAQKASYGPFQLLMVRTSAPLRHLHAPDECLRGIGMKVRYLGLDRTTMPSAVYMAESPDGTRFRIDVSFVSDRGLITTNVSEAVWHWLQQPSSTWTAIQRISPADTPGGDRKQFDAAVVAALDLTSTQHVARR